MNFKCIRLQFGWIIQTTNNMSVIGSIDKNCRDLTTCVKIFEWPVELTAHRFDFDQEYYKNEPISWPYFVHCKTFIHQNIVPFHSPIRLAIRLIMKRKKIKRNVETHVCTNTLFIYEKCGYWLLLWFRFLRSDTRKRTLTKTQIALHSFSYSFSFIR